MRSPRRIVLLFLLLLLGVSGFLYAAKSRREFAARARLAAILAGPELPLSLGARTKLAGCARGVFPDRACTPGAVFPDAGPLRICVPGYTKTVRNVPQKLREGVFAEYGVPYPEPRGAFEVDHLIPLALGGDNDIANLFPEAAEPFPGFREKDIVEVYLQDEVCASRVALNVAQEAIARDWLAIYGNLTPEQIQAIKTKFRNWSNE